MGDGSRYGVRLSYKVQPSPDGLAQAFLLGERFIGRDACAMVLGDNIFYGNGFAETLRAARENAEERGRATVFGYYVSDPSRFGVVELDERGRAISIEEKPAVPGSNYAVTGLYFYPAGVSLRAGAVRPSARGELEITSLNEMYLREKILDVQLLEKGFAWLDTGTVDSLAEATEFVRTVQRSQRIEISSPEEIAYQNGWIGREELLKSALLYGKSPYGAHLRRIAEGEIQYGSRNGPKRYSPRNRPGRHRRLRSSGRTITNAPAMRNAPCTSRGSSSSLNSARMSVEKAFVGYSAAG